MDTTKGNTLDYSRVTWHLAVTILGIAGIIYIFARFTLAGYMLITESTPIHLSMLSITTEVWYGVLLRTAATVAFGYFYFRIGLYAITLSHRYHSHKSFKILKKYPSIALALGFYSVFQTTITEWTGWHVEHHAKVDEPEDRTSPALYGALHAHMLIWMKKDFIQPADRKYSAHLKKDEYKNSMALERFYPILSVLMTFGVPVLICSLWLDPIGGFLFGACTRLFCVYHTTWSINSIMHIFGERLSDDSTARNSMYRWFIWLVVGEPSHATHHKYPKSYRLGEYDPGADFIEWMEKHGIVETYKRAPFY